VHSDVDLRALLERAETIAVVGASRVPGKAAYGIPQILLASGFDVVPVNPHVAELYGRRCFPSLLEITGTVDLVDVFRPPADAPEIARQAVQIGAPVLWLQLGILSRDARELAAAAGLTYVENRCLGAEVARLGIHKG
jgi:uncharacterized protein